MPRRYSDDEQSGPASCTGRSTFLFRLARTLATAPIFAAQCVILGFLLGVHVVRYGQIIFRCHTLKIVPSLAVVIDHHLSELLYIIVLRLFRGQLAQIDFCHVALCGLRRKLRVGTSAGFGGSAFVSCRALIGILSESSSTE